MSTNYYLIPSAAATNGVPFGWIQQVHIGQFAVGAFLLQAVRGDDSFDGPAKPHGKYTYWSPVSEFPTIETWDEWKNVINDPQFAVIDEYGSVMDKQEFMTRVDESDASKRFHDMTVWRDSNSSLAMFSRTDYMDLEGFSFEVKEFS